MYIKITSADGSLLSAVLAIRGRPWNASPMHMSGLPHLFYYVEFHLLQDDQISAEECV